MELDEFRAALDAWLDEHADELAPDARGLRHARRADGPPVEGEAAGLRRRLDAVGLARAGRRPRRLDAAARLPRRGAHRPRPRRARHLLDDRGAGADDDRLRPAGAGRRDGAAPAAGRRDLVPGLLRAEHRQQPRRRSPAGPSAPTTAGVVNGQKVWTSLAQYAQRCVLLTRTGTPESAHRGITALFVDMDTPGITVRPIEAMHGVRRVLRGVLRRRASCRSSARSATRARAGRWPWTCCPTSAAPRSGTAARYLHRRLEQLLGRGRAGRARRRARSARRSSSSTRSGPGRGPPSTGSPPASTLGAETSIDKVLLATAEQAVFDLAADGAGRRRWSSATTRRASGGAREFLYSRAATIYGGSAEIQRNIVARRLLDLGADR